MGTIDEQIEEAERAAVEAVKELGAEIERLRAERDRLREGAAAAKRNVQAVHSLVSGKLGAGAWRSARLYLESALQLLTAVDDEREDEGVCNSCGQPV